MRGNSKFYEDSMGLMIREAIWAAGVDIPAQSIGEARVGFAGYRVIARARARAIELGPGL